MAQHLRVSTRSGNSASSGPPGRHCSKLPQYLSSTCRAVVYLPWCFKIVAGIVSDCYPIYDNHRRPYFGFGWALFVVSGLVMWLLSEPGVAAVCFLAFLQTSGCVIADAVADGMLVEATSYEPRSAKGRMRIQGYLVRGLGMAAGAILGATLHNKGAWGWGITIGQCFLLQALLPVCTVFPWVCMMHEMCYRGESVKTPSEMVSISFEFLSIDAVHIPLFFLFFYNLCFVPNPLWANFLYHGLHLTNFQVGLLVFFGALLGLVGIISYDIFCFSTNWKKLYALVTLLGAFFSSLQLCLLYGFTFGLPDVVFATGDASLHMAVQYVQCLSICHLWSCRGMPYTVSSLSRPLPWLSTAPVSRLISFMPMAIMFLVHVPDGAECTVYALITTWLHIAMEMGFGLGAVLECSVSGVGNEALESGDWGGLRTVVWITSVIQVLPISFLFAQYRKVEVLPNGMRETRAQFDCGNKTWWGAAAFVTIFTGGILLTVTAFALVAFYPGLCSVS